MNGTLPNGSGDEFDTCGGLGRFDGESWASYIPGMCVIDYDFAPDGAVWVVVGRDSRWELTETYVITPEAVTATES